MQPEPHLIISAGSLADHELENLRKLAAWMSTRPDMSVGQATFWVGLASELGRMRTLREILWLEYSDRILSRPVTWDQAVSGLGEDTPS